MSVYWQDDHITEESGEFICYDECGLHLITTKTHEEAREQIQFYNDYILNNLTD